LIQALFGLANVLIDNGGEIQPIQVHLKLRGQQAGGKRLASAAWPGKEGAHSGVELRPERGADKAAKALAVATAILEIGQLTQDLRSDRELTPATARENKRGERFQDLPVQPPDRLLDVGDGDRVATIDRRVGPREGRRAADVSARHPKALAHRLDSVDGI